MKEKEEDKSLEDKINEFIINQRQLEPDFQDALNNLLKRANSKPSKDRGFNT